MAKLIKITGINKVIANMKIASSLSVSRIAINLKKAGLFIQRESQKIVPVDLNNLKPSARTDSKGQGSNTDVIVHYGAGADYAVFVHEDLDARHKPGKRAKFLESVIKEKRKEIFNIVAGKL